jgi:ethanolamine utilization cobalamin adenosyltransferase
MSVLTEAALRILLKDEDLGALREYRVGSDVIVTPSARGYLTDHRIDLVIGDKRVIKNPPARERERGGEPDGRNKPAEAAGARKTNAAAQDGKKPEHMTALRAGELVRKDHKIIKLRGKIDSFEAKLLETQLAFRKSGLIGSEGDVSEVLAYTRAIMRSEVLLEELPPMALFGMGEEEIHDRSHHPMKHFGMPHFMPVTADDGEAVLALNVLRTMAREVEIAAFEAFENGDAPPEREDILMALNRLSSALYVMMFRAKAEAADK